MGIHGLLMRKVDDPMELKSGRLRLESGPGWAQALRVYSPPPGADLWSACGQDGGAVSADLGGSHRQAATYCQGRPVGPSMTAHPMAPVNARSRVSSDGYPSDGDAAGTLRGGARVFVAECQPCRGTLCDLLLPWARGLAVAPLMARGTITGSPHGRQRPAQGFGSLLKSGRYPTMVRCTRARWTCLT